jgi:hypothetical protein
VMSCASLTRLGAVFCGIRVLPFEVMNQPSKFSLAPVSWACSLSCMLYSGRSGRTGRAKRLPFVLLLRETLLSLSCPPIRFLG